MSLEIHVESIEGCEVRHYMVIAGSYNFKDFILPVAENPVFEFKWMVMLDPGILSADQRHLDEILFELIKLRGILLSDDSIPAINKRLMNEGIGDGILWLTELKQHSEVSFGLY